MLLEWAKSLLFTPEPLSIQMVAKNAKIQVNLDQLNSTT